MTDDCNDCICKSDVNKYTYTFCELKEPKGTIIHVW